MCFNLSWANLALAQEQRIKKFKMSKEQELIEKIYALKLELSELRKESSPETVENFTFQTPQGATKLSNLFAKY